MPQRWTDRDLKNRVLLFGADSLLLVTALALVAVFASILTPTPALASSHGSLVGEVLADDGGRHGSVRVLLCGLRGVAERLTDADGRFRFARLAPGTYTLEVLRGKELIARYEPVAVRLGRPTTIRIQVRADPEATLVVTSEPPQAAIQPASTPEVDAAEVGLLAADRDPFRTVQSAGVRTLRSHAMGAAMGTDEEPDGASEIWRYDGVQMTAAPEASLPGGVRVRVLSSVDAARGSADSVIDLVSPRRASQRRGDVRLDYADRSWHEQDSSVPGAQTERLTGIAGAGLEAGLELAAERMWAWGSWQGQEVTRRALGPETDSGTGQETVSENRNLALKLSAQPLRSLSLALGYHDTERHRQGEGAAPDRSLEATRLEMSPSRWASFYAGWVAGPALSVDVQLAEARDAAGLVPTAAVGGIVLDSSGVWRGGFAELHHRENREQMSITGEGYHDLGWTAHRVRFGYEQRDIVSLDSERWGADNLQLLAGENFGSPFDLVRVRRSGTSEVTRTLQGSWLQDSLLFGRLTIDVGVRLDQQTGRARGGMADAHPLLPELLPELDYDGTGSLVQWSDVSPRLGLAWALGKERDTILRLSRASFASELHDDLIQQVSPVAGGEVLLGLGAPLIGPDPSITSDEDAPSLIERLARNRFAQPQGLDLSNPNAPANAFGPSLASERVDELSLTLEHHPARATELNLTWSERLSSGLLERRLLIRENDGGVRPALASDYRLDHVESGLLPDGSPYAVPVYGLADGIDYTGGSQLSNGDRTLRRRQLTAELQRRMSGGFQLRGHVTYTEWRWGLGNAFLEFDDPTDETSGVDGAGIHRADESGSAAFESGRWSFDVTTLYQVARAKPWGFDVGVSVHGREGYRLDYALDVVASDRLRQVEVASEGLRVDDLVTVDLRLQKELRLPARFLAETGAVIAFDVFNLLDSGAVLEREQSLRVATTGAPRRTLSPRVFQIGLRLALP